MLWPKYDPDLDTQVNGRPLIHEYINHTFAASNLQGDLAQLKKQKKVDDLIDQEVQRAAVNKKDVLALKTPKDPNVSLNQAQVFNVIEELYGIDTTTSRIGKAGASRLDKKGKAN